MPLHSPMEIAVLRALRSGRGWMGAAEIAVLVDLPLYGIRATLNNLRRRFLCHARERHSWTLGRVVNHRNRAARTPEQ